MGLLAAVIARKSPKSCLVLLVGGAVTLLLSSFAYLSSDPRTWDIPLAPSLLILFVPMFGHIIYGLFGLVSLVFYMKALDPFDRA